MTEAKDYVEGEDQEEVVLTRLGKLKQWWEHASTLVKIIKWSIMGFKLLFLGSTAAVVGGQMMGEKPLEGMLQEQAAVPHETNLDYQLLLEEVTTLQAEVAALEDRPGIAGIAGIAGPPGPPGKSITGPMGPPGESITGPPGKDGINTSTATSTTQISDALKLHIKGEH